MQTVFARLLQPTSLVIGLLVVVSPLVAIGLLILAGAAHDADQLVGPFRWTLTDDLG